MTDSDDTNGTDDRNGDDSASDLQALRWPRGANRRRGPGRLHEVHGPTAIPGVTGAAPGGDSHADEEATAALVAWLRREIQQRLSAPVTGAVDADPVPAAEGTAVTPELVSACMSAYAQQELRAGRAMPAPEVEEQAARRVHQEWSGYGRLQRLLDDPTIENINCNGADAVWVRRADGSRERVAPVADSDAELVALVRRIIARSGADERRLDRSSPAVSCELGAGGRLHAVIAVSHRPAVSIRRNRIRLASLHALQRHGTVDTGLRQFLEAAVRARLNIVVSGGTVMGKTTLLRAMCTAIPPRERLITIEDSRELALDHDPDAHPDLVSLQSRDPNIEGEGAISLAELVRWALRMSPDRVIVGEVRGAEVLPMLWAMSQGNDGALSSVHASSSRDTPLRLATYLLVEHVDLQAAAMMIAGAVHLIVHIAPALDGTRVVASIREVVGADGQQVVTNEIFAPRRDGRAVPAAQIRPATMERLIAAGLDPDVVLRPEGRWDA